MFTPLALANRPTDDYIGSPENGIFPYYGNNYEYGQQINSGLADITRIEDQLIPSVNKEGHIPLRKGYGFLQYHFLSERTKTSDVIRGNINIIVQNILTLIGNLFFIISKALTLMSVSLVEFCFSEKSFVATLLDEIPRLLGLLFQDGFASDSTNFIFFVVVIVLGISAIFSLLRGQIVNTFTNLFISILFIGFFIFYIGNSNYIIKPIMTSIDKFTAISIKAVENLESDKTLTIEESVFSLSDKLWNNVVGVVWATGQFGTMDIEVLKLKPEEVEEINTKTQMWVWDKPDVKKGFEMSGEKVVGDYYMDRVFLGGCDEVKNNLLEALSDNVGNRTGADFAPVMANKSATTGFNHLFIGLFSLLPAVLLVLFVFSVGIPIILAEVMLLLMFLILPIVILIAVAGESGRPAFIAYAQKFIQFFMTKIVLGFYLAFVLTILSLVLFLLNSTSGLKATSIILLTNMVVFGLAFWYRKKPLEMFLALLSFSSPGTSSQTFGNVRGEGNMATRLAGRLAWEKYRFNRYKNMLGNKGDGLSVPVDERPPNEVPRGKISSKGSPKGSGGPRDTPSGQGAYTRGEQPTSSGLHFDETKYRTGNKQQAPQDAKLTVEHRNFQQWNDNMDKGDYRTAESVLRKNSANIKDVDGNTVPTKIGQMENSQSREKAWDMYLRNKGNLELEDKNKQTAAYHAKTAREISQISRAGANLEHKDKDGNTPLNHAAKSERPEKVQVLIKEKVNLNTVDNEGKTPLINAAERKDYISARHLVEEGANLNVADNTNRTIKDYAKNDEILKNILKSAPENKGGTENPDF